MFVVYETMSTTTVTSRTMDQKSGKPSQKRRAILQGSLAAPLVLTVTAAGAQTALSSAGRALQNLKDEQRSGLPKSLYFKNSPDNWFREKVTVHQLRYRPDPTTPPLDRWYYLDPVPNGKYYLITSMVPEDFGASLPTGWEKIGEADAYLLVWVDPNTGDRELKMTAEPANGLIGATCSALRSVIPTACPTGNSG